MSPSLDWRSVSWTKRGFQHAASEVLWQAWTYHNEYTGAKAPFDLAEIQAKFAEEIV